MENFLMILLLSISVAMGEDEKKNETSRVRVIAVGEDPRGDLAFIPPPLTYLPPRIFLQNSDGNVAEVSLKLGEFSGAIEVPGGTITFPVRLENRAEMEPWLEVTLPGTGDYLVCLRKLPGNQNGGWKRIESRVVSLGGRDQPEKPVRFVNASAVDMVFRLGDKKAQLVPPGSLVASDKPLPKTAMIVGFRAEKGAFRLAHRESFPQFKEGEQVTYLAHDDQSAEGIKILKEVIDVSEKDNH